MSRSSVQVIKLGGSLFADSRLPSLATNWLATDRRRAAVILAGGGLWADGVRDAYQRFGLDETFCHWLCVDLLSQTAELAARLLQLPLITDWDELNASLKEERPFVFSCAAYLRDVEPQRSASPLPHSWNVTTDSIAARIAEHLGADELALWKSTLPPKECVDLQAWSAADYVDEHFPVAAARLRVRAVDLLTGREVAASGGSSTCES